MLSYVSLPLAMTTLTQSPWRGFAENPAAMRAVFDEIDASLAAVRLMRIDDRQSGSGVRLKVALKYARPRPLAGCDRVIADAVSIELHCFGLEELSVSMQPGDSSVYCDITSDNTGNRVLRIAGPSIDLLIRCGFLQLNHILPYTAESAIGSA